MIRSTVLIYATAWLIAFGCSTRQNDSREDNAQDDGIALADLDGNIISLESYEGKVVFLNLWATWCGPCIKEMPSIAQLMDDVKDEDVAFLFASNEEVKKIQAFAAKRDFPFNYVQLKTPLEDLNVAVIPVTYLIDKNGHVQYTEKGMRDWSTPESKQLITSLLN